MRKTWTAIRILPSTDEVLDKYSQKMLLLLLLGKRGVGVAEKAWCDLRRTKRMSPI